MRKQNSIIFGSFIFFTTITLTLSGCGVKGPLYQTPPSEEVKADTLKDTNKINNTNGKDNKQVN